MVENAKPKKDSKKATKKESKKTSKKPRKVVKPDSKKKSKKSSKKVKIYCGIENPIPANSRMGTMQECFNAGKVNYYGIKKIDSKVLNSTKKVDTMDSKSLMIKYAGLVGKYRKIEKEIKTTTNADEKNKLMKEYEAIGKDINLIQEQLKKIKK
jgi:hypothetical protein